MCRPRWTDRLIRPLLRALIVALLLGAGAEPALATPTPTPTPTNTATPTPTATATPVATSFVSGKVFEDTNDDGIRNNGEDGVSDVTVKLQANNKSGSVRKTKTGSSGGYKFSDLAAGTYVVTVEAPDDWETTTSEQLEVKVNGTDGTAVADFGLLETVVATPTPTPVALTTTQSNPVLGGSTAPGGIASAAAPVTVPTPTATPTPSLAQQFAASAPLRSAHFTLLGRADDNGQVTDFLAEGNGLEPDRLDLHMVINGQDLNIIVVGDKAYMQNVGDELWQPTDLSALQRLHGGLSPIGVLTLPDLSKQVLAVRAGALEEIDGGMAQRYELDIGPPAGGLSTNSGQLEVLGGLIEVWIYPYPGPFYGLIYQEHLQLAVPSVRQDQSGRVEPAWLDSWIRYSEHNAPFSVNAPQAIAQPAPPVRASAPAPAPVRPAGPAGGGPAPAARAVPPSQGPAPEPPPSAPATSSETQAVEIPLERSLAADRALQALAGGTGPRAGSRLEPDGVLLAVPWRSQLGPVGVGPSTDGAASIGMILEAFGVTAGTADLQALAETWQPTWGPAEPVQLQTLVRIGERGWLHPLGPAVGSAGGEWSAATAHDFLRRGYPVLALVRPELLAPPASAGQPDRYVVLMGFQGDYLLYHDPYSPDGAARKALSADLDQAWESTVTPRQGMAFGFGASVAGLLDSSARQIPTVVTANPPATVVADSPPPMPTAQPINDSVEVASSTPSGLHPALMAFLALVTGGVGFVLARLLR
jgi:hypothetical protein